MKPTYNNLFVEQMKKESTTAAGIILTSDVETGSKPAVVVAVGPDAVGVKPGMNCYIKWNESVPVTHNGVKGAFISEEHVLAYF